MWWRRMLASANVGRDKPWQRQIGRDKLKYRLKESDQTSIKLCPHWHIILIPDLQPANGPHFNSQRAPVVEERREELSVDDGSHYFKSTHVCLHVSHCFNPADLCLYSTLIKCLLTAQQWQKRVFLLIKTFRPEARSCSHPVSIGKMTNSNCLPAVKRQGTLSSSHVLPFNIQCETPMFLCSKFALGRNMKAVRRVLNRPPWHLGAVKCSSLRKLKGKLYCRYFKEENSPEWEKQQKCDTF